MIASSRYVYSLPRLATGASVNRAAEVAGLIGASDREMGGFQRLEPPMYGENCQARLLGRTAAAAGIDLSIAM